MKSLMKGLILCTLLTGFLAASAGEAEVQRSVGKKAPIPVTMSAPVASAPAPTPPPPGPAADALATAAPVPATATPQPVPLPNDMPITFTAPPETPLSARVWNKVGNTEEECDPIAPIDDNKLVIDMADINCPGFVVNKLRIQVTAGTEVAEFTMPNKMMETFDNIGIALTLVDRWSDKTEDGKSRVGARVNGGAGIYSSISNLKNNHVGLIGNVSVLDQASDLDFELGVGLGFLFKFQRLGEENGFGMAAGVGYNLMLAEEDDRWYTFIGFSMDFDRGEE